MTPPVRPEPQQGQDREALKRRVAEIARQRGVSFDPAELDAAINQVLADQGTAPGQSPRGALSPNIQQVARSNAKIQEELNQYQESQRGLGPALGRMGQNAAVGASQLVLSPARLIARLFGGDAGSEWAQRNAQQSRTAKWSPEDLGQLGVSMPEAFLTEAANIAPGAIPPVRAATGAAGLTAAGRAGRTANLLSGSTAAGGAGRLVDKLTGRLGTSLPARAVQGAARGAAGAVAANPYEVAFEGQGLPIAGMGAAFGGSLGALAGRSRGPGAETPVAPPAEPDVTTFGQRDLSPQGLELQPPVFQPPDTRALDPNQVDLPGRGLDFESPIQMGGRGAGMMEPSPRQTPRAGLEFEPAFTMPQQPQNFDPNLRDLPFPGMEPPLPRSPTMGMPPGMIDVPLRGGMPDLGAPREISPPGFGAPPQGPLQTKAALEGSMPQPVPGRQAKGKKKQTTQQQAQVRNMAQAPSTEMPTAQPVAGAIPIPDDVVSSPKAQAQALGAKAKATIPTEPVSAPAQSGKLFNPGIYDKLPVEEKAKLLRAAGMTDETMVGARSKQPFDKLPPNLRPKVQEAFTAGSASGGGAKGSGPFRAARRAATKRPKDSNRPE